LPFGGIDQSSTMMSNRVGGNAMLRPRSVIKGVPRSRRPEESEYWALVNQLMDLGWYRLGEGRDTAGRAWGFRAGHTLPVQAYGNQPTAGPEVRWIVAKSETCAMRRLLKDLQAASVTRHPAGESGNPSGR
jgi:hypothetical protein